MAKHPNGQKYVLASDRDSGLWIFHYTPPPDLWATRARRRGVTITYREHAPASSLRRLERDSADDLATFVQAFGGDRGVLRDELLG